MPMTEIESVPYLVHFPDRDEAVHNIEIGRVAEVDTEILDGWGVDGFYGAPLIRRPGIGRVTAVR